MVSSNKFSLAYQIHSQNFPYFSGVGKPEGKPSDVPDAVTEDDGRAGLMAAIRNAGGKKGAKLKNAKERKKERKQEKAATSSGGGGGDLMSDLFSRITMRRKGISGSKQEGREDRPNADPAPMSPMDKISAMIPPPSKTDRSESHDSGDWD